MRNAFIERLVEMADTDPSVFLVVGDLGYSVVEPFMERYPERFLNAGVAEQNMTLVASGLAREGYKVFTYSIGNFTTLRCLEQIRNDVCYHQLNVTVVSVGGGYMYGSLGPSHHLTEDVSMMRTLPGMRVYVPYARTAAAMAVDEIVAEPGPAYVRLGRAGLDVETVSHTGLQLLKPFDDRDTPAEHAVICMGQIGEDVLALCQREQADLYSLCRVSPAPVAELAALAARYRSVLTFEDHQQVGGLHALLNEAGVAAQGYSVQGRFCSWVGKEYEIRQKMINRKTDEST